MTIFNTKKLKNAYERFYEPESQRRIADLYWPVLLVLTVVLVFLSVGYGMAQFFMPPQVVVSQVSVQNASIGFSAEDLLVIVEHLEKRKEVFEELLTR